MRPTTLLIGFSLAANAALAAVLALRPEFAPPPVRTFLSARADRVAAPPTPVSPVPEAAIPAPRMWDLLRTPDPKELVARLRAAGFPAGAIRAIVFAEVGERHEDRLRELYDPDPDTPFWKLPGWHANTPERMPEILRLQREQSRLFNELLGDDLAFATEAFGDPRKRYGDLPRPALRAVQQIEDDYNEMTQLLHARVSNIEMPEDREVRRLLEKEKLADLAAALTPGQLEEYQLRNSRTAQHLRLNLTLFEATEDEYRTLYRLTEASIDTVAPDTRTWPTVDETGRQARLAEHRQQVKAALGEARYADYVRTTNDEFRQLHQLAAHANLPPDAAVQAFALRDTVTRESNRIREDAALDAAQKRHAFAALATATRTQIRTVLGAEVGSTYAQLAGTWLSALERGSGVTFTDGQAQFHDMPGPVAVPKR